MDYTYDAWARLKTSLTTGSTQFAQWGLKWAYDRYGNRTNQTVTHGSGPSSSLGISTSTNRITDSGYTYDSSGNLTNDGLNALVYDGENHVTSSTQSGATANYTYDGGGLRIKKVSGSTTTIYIFSGTKVIAEYENGASVTSPTREYLYSGGQLLASLEGSTTRYHLNDHLSTRVLADTSGTAVAESGHFPFGENWYSSGTPGSLAKWKFTTYERDSESGNDFAMARYYVNRLGRFNLPDPLGSSPYTPQRLNLYSYVTSDPINQFDPLGLQREVIPLLAPDFGGCYIDRVESSCALVYNLLTNGAALKCPNNDCSMVLYARPDGYILIRPAGYMLLDCIAVGEKGWDCSWRYWSRQFVAEDQRMDHYLTDDARWNYVFSEVYRRAGAVSDIRFIAAWYAAAALSGGSTEIIIDYYRGAEGSLWFGRAYSGGNGILNNGRWIRLGFGWSEPEQAIVFRLAGRMLKYILNTRHLDFWYW